jgi:site-specific recombinase XerC
VPTSDRRVAAALVEQGIEKLRAAREWALAGQIARLRVSDVFDRFEKDQMPALAPGAQASYRDSLTPLRLYFVDELENPLADTIETRHVEDFLAWRRAHRLDGEGRLSNRTLQKDRVVLHRIFKLAKKRRDVLANPVEDTEIPKADPRHAVIWTDDQFEALLKAIGKRPMLRLFALVLNETGMRCESEALWLRWEDVALDARRITIRGRFGEHRTKSGKGRVVPITPRLHDALREYFARYRFTATESPCTWRCTSATPGDWCCLSWSCCLQYGGGDPVADAFEPAMYPSGPPSGPRTNWRRAPQQLSCTTAGSWEGWQNG